MEEPSDVYGVEGVEIFRSSCGSTRPAADSGARALGEGEGVDNEGCEFYSAEIYVTSRAVSPADCADCYGTFRER